MAIEIHNLAVLRSATEGKHLGTYFGSWGALDGWIRDTRELGWVDSEGRPTDKGAALAAALDLSNAGDGRAYMWRTAKSLVSAARQLVAVKG
jgi:hypothetical protein